jgi:glycosyltransferase involved in cell wall biosynthesis
MRDRVVLFKHCLYPWWIDLAHALSATHEVRLLVSRTGGSENRYYHFETSDLDVVNLAGDRGTRRYTLRFNRYLASLGGASRAVIFDPKSSLNGVLFGLACMVRHLPYVSIVSENRMILPSAPAVVTGIRRLLHRVGLWVTARSHAIVCESPLAATYLQALGVARTTVQPHGIDLDRIRPSDPDRDLARRFGIDESRLRILYLGGSYANKGYEYLLRAIEADRNDAQFVIGGGGPAWNEGRHQDPRIIHVPLWPAGQLNALLSLADFLIVPSVSDDMGAERSPNVVIEGLAAGLTVLGSTCGAVPFYVGDDGFVFEERRERGVLDAFEFARTTRVNRPAWRARARGAAERRFDIRRYGELVMT